MKTKKIIFGIGVFVFSLAFFFSLFIIGAFVMDRLGSLTQLPIPKLY